MLRFNIIENSFRLKKSSGGRVISKNKYCETLVSINTNKQYFLYELSVGRVFQISLPLWSRCLFSAHAPLERSARAGESRVADSKRFSQASRKTVKKKNQNFQSVESSFTVFFLRKKPRRKKKSSHQDPGISPTHRSVQKQWSEITLRFLSPEGSLLRSEESEEKTELGSIHEFPFSQNTSYPSHI